MTQRRSARHTYRAESIADLLNVLPVAFGFVPEESLVAVGVTGDRLGLHARLDLGDGEDLDAVAATLAGAVNRHCVDGVIVIALSENAELAEESVYRAADEITVPIRELVWATSSQYWTANAGGSESTPWSFDWAHVAIAVAVAEGQMIVPRRNDLRSEFAACGPGSDAAAELTEAASQISSSAGLIAHWRHIDGDNARTQAQWWTRVAQGARSQARPAALFLAAFAWWRSGDGARALVAADACRAAEPSHPHLPVLLGLIDACVPPGEWEQMLGQSPDVPLG